LSAVYTATFSGVTCTAAQDLFSIRFATGGFKLLMFELSADAASAAQANIRLSIIRRLVTSALGSGGTVITPPPAYDTDSAFGGVVHANDTTRATGTTSQTQWSASINVLNGYQWLPPPEIIFSYSPAVTCVIGLETIPVSTVFDGTVVFCNA
jgi:hypothetical protein